MAETPNWIDSVYQLKLRQLRDVAQSEFEALLGEMRGLKPGADLVLLSRSGGKLADDAVARCEAAIPELVTAHVQAGNRDVAGIAEQIRAEFVDVALNGLPGAALYVSVRGGVSATAEGKRLRQSEDARFSGRRTSLRDSVVHYVVREVGQSPLQGAAASTTDQARRRFAATALANLYVAITNPSVTGKALRHRLKEVVQDLDARRALARTLVPELASRSGTEDDDYYKPTLACLLDFLPHCAEIVDATLDMLRLKYEREGDFRSYTWEELQSHCEGRSLALPFSREGVIQILAVAALNSGWYRTHWGTPRNLEVLLEARSAYGLLPLTAADEPLRTVSIAEPANAGGLPERFEVALSFPGSVREQVEPVATLLAQELGHKAVFYDRFYTALLARPNLDVVLQDVYRNRSRLLVVFVGRGYQERAWCGIEWRAIRDIMKSRQDHRVMLVRIDDAQVDGVFSIDGYVDLRETTTSDLARLVLERLASLAD